MRSGLLQLLEPQHSQHGLQCRAANEIASHGGMPAFHHSCTQRLLLKQCHKSAVTNHGVIIAAASGSSLPPINVCAILKHFNIIPALKSAALRQCHPALPCCPATVKLGARPCPRARTRGSSTRILFISDQADCIPSIEPLAAHMAEQPLEWGFQPFGSDADYPSFGASPGDGAGKRAQKADKRRQRQLETMVSGVVRLTPTGET